VPQEQITKALSLGASQFAVIYRIVLPQIMPRLIDAARLALGGAWLFLIAAEAIASTDGLGYRIFLMRRYLAMDVILPYVMWITLLGFLMDYGLRRLVMWRYRWSLGGR
jgi:NitT/TauT family transport system permease protein